MAERSSASQRSVELAKEGIQGLKAQGVENRHILEVLAEMGRDTSREVEDAVTLKGADKPVKAEIQLTPEERRETWLVEFGKKFDKMPQLHRGIKKEDVIKSLRADTESTDLFQ